MIVTLAIVESTVTLMMQCLLIGFLIYKNIKLNDVAEQQLVQKIYVERLRQLEDEIGIVKQDLTQAKIATHKNDNRMF
jgi:hypothetical protein